jgi:exodeoxyribonuclease V alpha subunit
MLFSLPSVVSKQIGYSTCTDCLLVLADIQAIDYYFANNAILQRYERQSESAFFNEKESLAQLFHVLLALSYFQRQGHSCLSISAIADKTYWSEIDAAQGNEALKQKDTPTKTGFAFANSQDLGDVIQRFTAIVPSRKDIEWDEPNLYTARYINYENEIAQFFREQQLKCLVSSDPMFAHLQQCADTLWPTLFPIKPKQGMDWQKVSVANGLISQTSIISGGAGTGKTYTVARLLLSWLFMQKKAGLGKAKLILAAPTGKAAQRLNESILGEFTQLLGLKKQEHLAALIADLTPLVKAKTIHRLLGLGMHGIEPKYNEKKQLDCDFLVVDEVSMIDLAMMAKLLRALPKGANLVLIGDANQLPSVESGGLLKDLVNQEVWRSAATLNDYSSIYSESHVRLLTELRPSLGSENFQKVNVETNKTGNTDVAQKTYQYNHVTFLQTSMRSQNEITQLAQYILQGQVKPFVSLLSQCKKMNNGAEVDNDSAKQQLSLLMDEPSAPAITWLENVYTPSGTINAALLAKIAQRYHGIFASRNANEAIEGLKQYRLLSPTKKGRLGTEFLNTQIEQQLRKRFSHINVGQVYRGMPIMIVQNDYRLHLFNGDVGVIWPNEQGDLVACFPDPESPETHCAFSITSLPVFELVYAMTIHKTQGSEFEHVDILLPNIAAGNANVNNSQHLSRELLYTGVTRAKGSIGIIASLSVLTECIEKTSTRFSGLKRKLSV